MHPRPAPMVSGPDQAADARAQAEVSARASYGRLLALLSAQTSDVQAAEDALADAFERALRRWPIDGVPRNPTGWLMTVARNRQRDHWRSAAARTSVPLDIDHHAPTITEDVDRLPDHRLELMLVCADERINAGVRTPLMLNVVLGYTAAQIGQAFVIPASTMASRLVRAKRQIKTDRIPFTLPDADDLEDRLTSIREAVYGAYTIEWPAVPRERQALLLGLGDLLTELVPADPESHGLAALMDLISARVPARLDADGGFVPLDRQDPARWDQDLIERGHVHLRAAHRVASVGRFQLEAAIAALHCARGPHRSPDWATLHRLHTSLQQIAPSLGGEVALAMVVAELRGPAAGLEALDDLDAHTGRFQPAWSARAHLLDRVDRPAEAQAAYERARELSTDPAERAYLAARQAGSA